ncbi:MAG: proprotein convertase P-domain-containing protein, partial [Crocinitomicaceae bacterium]|nr:proprotein convertase P-domain-containing protein [Crocinitomicaceae bacterium]
MIRKITRAALLLSFAFCLVLNSFGQLAINQGALTAQQLAENLAGPNVTVFNATFTGDITQQAGDFIWIGPDFEINSGIVLTNGFANNMIGPNNQGAITGSINGWGDGDADLDALSGVTTQDAAVLEFDFTVQTSTINFDYIFGSEEYPEWANTQFNDVFAFFISGPGIVGLENIALVPSTTSGVSINTINATNFWQFYRDNSNGNTNIQYDGYTTTLIAEKTGLIPCQTYHLKLAIADGSDDVYDTGVFLKENSLTQGTVTASTLTPNGDGIALEGCIQASFTFELDAPQLTDYIIPLTVGGTALNGVDYQFLDPEIIVPAGQLSATIIIDAYSDGLTEGQETIDLTFTPVICGPSSTVTLFIDDNSSIEYTTLATDLNCYEDSSGIADLTVTGGFPPYIITLTDSATGLETDYSAAYIDELPAGTYYIEITDAYGCEAEAEVIGANNNAGQTWLPDGNGDSYNATLSMAGFTPGTTIQNAAQFNGICLTMEHSYANDLEIELTSPSGTTITLKNSGATGGTFDSADLGEPVTTGPADDINTTDFTPGTGYEYCWTSIPTYGTMSDFMAGPPDMPNHTYTNNSGDVNTDYYYPAGSYTPEQDFSAFVGDLINGDWELTVTDNWLQD